MKKVFSELALVFCLSFLAAGAAFAEGAAFAPSQVADKDGRTESQVGSPSLRVLATTFPVWLMVRNVTADIPGVDVDLMIPAQAGCPHDYALTPQDRRKLEKADILVMNGLGLEAFLGPDPAAFGSSLRLIDASAGMTDVLSEQGGPNPHLFASPRMAARMAVSIGERLAALDPARAEACRKNAASYVASLQRLADEFAGLGEKVRNRRIVTQHEAFDYLARDAGLAVVAVVRNDENREPSASEMIRLIKEVRSDGAGGIFTEPQYPASTARTLSAETGVPLAELDPVATGPVGSDDIPLDYYQRVMTANLQTLEKTLGLR